MSVLHAKLIEGPTVAQHVIELLLKGIFVQVTTDKGVGAGYIHQLDFAKDSDHVFALVHIPGSSNEDEGLEVGVAIKRNGDVVVLTQDDE